MMPMINAGVSLRQACSTSGLTSGRFGVSTSPVIGWISCRFVWPDISISACHFSGSTCNKLQNAVCDEGIQHLGGIGMASANQFTRLPGR